MTNKYYAVYFKKNTVCGLAVTRSGSTSKALAIFFDRQEAQDYYNYVSNDDTIAGYRIAEVTVKEAA